MMIQNFVQPILLSNHVAAIQNQKQNQKPRHGSKTTWETIAVL